MAYKDCEHEDPGTPAGRWLIEGFQNLQGELARSREREDLLRAELEHVESLFEGDCLRRPKAKANGSPKLETPTAAAPAETRSVLSSGGHLDSSKALVSDSRRTVLTCLGSCWTSRTKPQMLGFEFPKLSRRHKPSHPTAAAKDRPKPPWETAAQQLKRAVKKGWEGLAWRGLLKGSWDLVRELEPESALCLIDTDLTVEVLPSEQTEAEQRAEEERQAKEEAAAREAAAREEMRLQRCRLKAEELPAEPSEGAVQLLLRLPAGGRLQRRFARSAPLQQVLTWVESEPDAFAEPGDFRLVQKWPGHCRELGPAEAEQSLSSLNFARQEENLKFVDLVWPIFEG
eukprot:s173_g6.t1